MFQKSILSEVSIEISIFQIFYRNFDFRNFRNFEILKINFLQDEKIFFVRIFFNCLGMFFHSPKHAFWALMISSERCYSVQAHCIFLTLHNSSKFTQNRVDPGSPIIYKNRTWKFLSFFFKIRFLHEKYIFFFDIFFLSSSPDRGESIWSGFRTIPAV